MTLEMTVEMTVEMTGQVVAAPRLPRRRQGRRVDWRPLGRNTRGLQPPASKRIGCDTHSRRLDHVVLNLDYFDTVGINSYANVRVGNVFQVLDDQSI